MEQMKRRWRLLIAAVAVITGIALVNQNGAGASVQTAAPRLTSVEIANAVLFNEGPAAQYLASFQRSPVRWDEDGLVAKGAVLNAIRNDTSGYYSSTFAQQMQSGDPEAIEGALDHLGSTTKDALVQSYGQQRVNDAIAAAPGVITNEDTNVSLAVVTAIAVIVAVIIVALVFAPVDQGGKISLRTKDWSPALPVVFEPDATDL